MIKKLAWETFKNTGDINTFLEFKEISEIEETIKAEENENYKDKRNNNFRT